MVKIPSIPQERFSYIVKQFNILQWIGSPEQKSQIFSAYLALADSGNVQVMGKVARAYVSQGNESSAMFWFERAARADDLSSILVLARKAIMRRDINTATFWHSKARGKCHTPSKIREFNSIAFLINLHNMGTGSGNRGNAGFNASGRSYSDYFNRGRQRADQGYRKAEETRNNSYAQERTNLRAELSRLLGNFSTLAELNKNWREWSRKNHPDKGGNEEEFKRVLNLMDAVKKNEGWN